jgi:hypothetical protein
MPAASSRAMVPSFRLPSCHIQTSLLAKRFRLTLRNGTVDGSQDGAAHGLGASCAGVVDGEARDYVAGELGFAKDGDTVVRSFAHAVGTCQFCVHDIADNLQPRLAVDLRWILEGVLELNGEVDPTLKVLDRLILLHVPGDRGVAAGLVDGLGIAIGAVRPVGGAVCGGVGEWVWVVDGEGDGDITVFNAVDDEVCDLEGISGELLVLELELPRQGGGSGEDEGDAHGDGVDELHDGDWMVDSCLWYALTDGCMWRW